MSDGVAQGDGLGPLFFSLGLDELLTAVREAMRDLNVDSTMLGQVFHTVGSTDGRLDCFKACSSVPTKLMCPVGPVISHSPSSNLYLALPGSAPPHHKLAPTLDWEFMVTLQVRAESISNRQLLEGQDASRGKSPEGFGHLAKVRQLH